MQTGDQRRVERARCEGIWFLAGLLAGSSLFLLISSSAFWRLRPDTESARAKKPCRIDVPPRIPGVRAASRFPQTGCVK
ncbi:hypothetical protein B1812_20695 [Methylocystis bryophila]|uniref:Uncharacterized protein n=1 Tax=Methylocystis bryophila TaxID=655015 RepID=A0A1W6MZU0_9HYPH|nr:hypothetical protein B1812_20695 [Methylocystis bryophila]